MLATITHYIDGRRTAGRSGKTAPVFNPATGEQTGEVVLANSADANEAVASASRAAAGWADVTPLRRTRILNRFLRIVEERADELAAVITAEHGKILSDAKGEVQRGI
jgi:malonate-semialdehyde dehydrogenase (acetylating)/methylmalonate-semialdehyde dehydrogenase